MASPIINEPLDPTSASFEIEGDLTGNLLSQTTSSETTAFVGNRVFSDLNGNGIQDDGDLGIDGVTVTLFGAGSDRTFGTADDIQRTGTTANGGYFGFGDLAASLYKLSFSSIPAGLGFSPFGQGSDGLVDSDVNPDTGETFTFELQAGEQNNFIDAGLVVSGGYATEVPSVQAVPQDSSRFNYGEALQKSFLFYEAQRSGDLPSDNRIAWRGDSALNDGNDIGLDLSGGYFDAGDHVKYNFPMAATMTLLSWGVEQYRDGYEQSGQIDEALDAIRWGTDFLLKSHVVENGQTKEFWAQVGNPAIDQSVLELPEQLNTSRPAFKIDATTPGSDLAAEAAAAMAAASIIFRPTDSDYAAKLLLNAQQLYTFADQNRGSYTAALPDESSPYRPQTGFEDELAWGAIWLHKALKATGETSQDYITKAEAQYSDFNFGWTHDWDNKSQGAAILLAQETGKDIYKNDVSSWLNHWQPGGFVSQTSGGLAWLSGWGSLRLSANTAFLAGIYADTVADPNGIYSQFATSQIDYLLGDNPRGSSYVVGFGNNSPQRVHHQAAFGSTETVEWQSDQINQNIIYGGLVGGPTTADDFSYQDDRGNFQSNEVGLDYNAGYTGALARLYSQYGGEPLSDEALNALPGIQVSTVSAQAIPSGPSALPTPETDLMVVIGGDGNDAINGTAGDDELTGAAGDDFLQGGSGNDLLYGTDSLRRGNGEVDRLTGGAGEDIFFLGDANGSFYINQRGDDYAFISDFDVNQDQLFLEGSPADYSFSQGQGETWIFRGTGDDRDFIASLGNGVAIDLGNQLYA